MNRLYPKRCLYLLSVLSVCFSSMLLGQGANPYTGGDVTFRTQFDVDTFENGALYTSTNGNLTIDATGTITNLSNFADLESVGGELTITNYGADETVADPLAAFASLNTTDGVRIVDDVTGNPGIRELKSVTIDSIHGDLEIGNNINVIQVNFSSLRQVDKDLIVRNNEQLTPFGANNLNIVGGDFRFNDNDDVVNFQVVTRLDSVGGSIFIRNNQALSGTGSLGFRDNTPTFDTEFTNFVVDSLVVEDNFELSTLAIDIRVNKALIIQRNSNLATVGDQIVIGATDPFAIVTDTINAINISDNPDLTSVADIFDYNPTIIVREFIVERDSTLDNFGGQKFNVLNNLIFNNVDDATRLPLVEETTRLQGDLIIKNNDQLNFAQIRSNARLNKLKVVEGNVEILGNSALSRLQAVGNIDTILGTFNLNGNSVLSNLDDLTELDSIGVALNIIGNALLSNCCQLPCQVIVNDAPFDGFNEAITILNNTGGCADKRAVVTTCVNDSDKGCLQAAPVKFLNFTGTLNGTAVDLDWSTASETDNDYFEIERAVGDDGRFAAIGRVNGAGDSQVQRDYTYTDYDFPGTLTYYRLRQVDFDGTYDYSNVVVIEGAATQTAAALTLYPNPTGTGGVSVQLGEEWNAEQLVVEVFSASGQRVRRRVGMPGKQLQLPTADLQGGVYIVRVTDGYQSASERLLVR